MPISLDDYHNGLEEDWNELTLMLVMAQPSPAITCNDISIQQGLCMPSYHSSNIQYIHVYIYEIKYITESILECKNKR